MSWLISKVVINIVPFVGDEKSLTVRVVMISSFNTVKKLVALYFTYDIDMI